jgi:hypothetical protein
MNKIEKKYSTLKTKVLEHIETEHISPHTRIYFIIRTFVALFSIVILLLFALYTVSLTLYALQKSGLFLLSPFGVYGVFSIVNGLPWKLVFISFFSLLGLLMLTKNTFSVYRLPLLYLFLFVIGFVGVSGLYVAKSGMHPYVMTRIEREVTKERLKPVSLYLKPNVDLITVGVLVSSSTDQGFALLASNGDQLEVMVNKDTKYFRKDLIVKGDIVLVFGERRGRVVFAGAVRELAKEESRYMR